MGFTTEILKLIDNGGRRIGNKRREFSYTNHIPNGRSKKDRRGNVDRRSGLERRKDADRRSGLDRRIAFTRALFT